MILSRELVPGRAYTRDESTGLIGAHPPLQGRCQPTGQTRRSDRVARRRQARPLAGIFSLNVLPEIQRELHLLTRTEPELRELRPHLLDTNDPAPLGRHRPMMPDGGYPAAAGLLPRPQRGSEVVLPSRRPARDAGVDLGRLRCWGSGARDAVDRAGRSVVDGNLTGVEHHPAPRTHTVVLDAPVIHGEPSSIDALERDSASRSFPTDHPSSRTVSCSTRVWGQRG